MKGLKRIGVVALCGVMLIMSACGQTSNGVADEGDVKSDKVESVTLERADGSASPASISEEDYDECREYIEDIYKEIGEYDERDYANDGDIAGAVEKVAQLAETWKEEGIATTVTKHESYVYIKFTNGIRYFFAPATPGTSAVGSDTHVSVYSLQPAKTEFASRNDETKTADDNATDVAAKKIADTYDNYDWEYDLDDKELTIPAVMGFGSNEVILWNGHGCWFEECGSALALSETIYDVYYTDVNILYIENDGSYLVTSDFVDAYISDLTNTFLYLSTCSGLRDTGLAEAFKNKGAAAIVANTDVITTIYTSNIMSAVVDGLLDGKDLNSAMVSAKEKYGEQDSILYEEDGALGNAVPTVYCGGDYTFAEVDLDVLADGEYQSDYEYTGSISDDLSVLTINTRWWHYDNTTWEEIEDYAKKEYHIPISDDCKVSAYEAEVITTPIAEMADRLKSFIDSGNMLTLTIVVENGEIVEFKLIS